MKKAKVWKWIAATGTSLLFLFTFIFSMGGNIFSLKPDGESEAPITARAADAALNSNYGALLHASSYYYSDVTKIDGFRAGTSGYDTDVSTNVVDRSATHGTVLNPFVINTAAQWNYFAGDTANATNANNVFVLGADIDFGSVNGNFKPIPSLGAKFYGANHVLRNITHAFSTNNSAADCGVFKVATATAIITDLCVDNVNFTGTYLRTGLICGNSAASVLNCHARGKLSGALTGGTGALYDGAGGLIGNLNTSSSMVYVYRCSVQVEMTYAINQDAPSVAALVGDVDSANSSILDCLAIGKFTLSPGSNGLDVWFGGITTINYCSTTINIKIEDCVAYVNITDTTTRRRSQGSLFNGWVYNGNTTTPKVAINNTYSAGNLSGNAKATGDLYGVLWPAANNISFSSSNVNWYAQSPVTHSGVSVAGGTPSANKVTTGQYNNSAGKTRSDLWTAATKDPTLPDKIWIKKNLISETYMTNTAVTSTTGYTIENTPVKNPLKITVSYFDYKRSGNTQYAINDSLVPIEVKAGESLYKPAEPENRKFLGWTTDVTGNSDPFTAVPSNMLGDNKLYAMWEVKKADIALTVTGEGSDFAGDNTNGYSMTYNTSGISIQPVLTVTGMYNNNKPNIKYQWNKGGTPIAVDGTSETFTVVNVPDSDKYSVTMKLEDANEPLFRGEFTSDAVDIEIIPAELRCDGIIFENGQPYSGAPYPTAVPTAIVKDKEEGIAVKGTTQWGIDLSTFNNDSNTNATIDKEKNTETTTIIFTPAAEYNGNYGDEVTFTVTFDIQYLKFIFNIPRINNLKLEVNLEYGQHYTYNNVVTMFEEVFEPYLGNLAGNTPAFIVGEQTIKINDYRKITGTGANATTAYGNVDRSYTIEVTFVPQSYTVSFDARNEGNDTYADLEIGHGIRIPKPTDPTYGSQLFLGWYYDYTDPDTKKTEEGIAWNFDVDRVTHELQLYAKWLQADKLIGLEVTPSPLIQYMAKQALDPAYLTVKAIFEGTAEGQTLTQKMVLSAGQYTISYEGGKTVLHAKADPEEKSTIIFKYSYNGTTVTAELNVIVEKIKVDTSKLKQYFKDTAVVVTGGAQSMKAIDAQRISQLLPEIAGCKVEYKYYNSGEDEISPSEVVNVGTYYVRAYFTPTDVDYDAPYIQAIFQIVNEKIKLKIDWGETEFVFNGKEQMPTPTFTDELGEKVTANYTYKITRINNTIEELEPIKARTDYLITISLEDLAYEIDGDVYTPFMITVATLELPEQIKHFPYIGEEYDLNALSASECENFFKGFDLSMMRVNSGDSIKGDKGTNAGRYNASVILLDPDSAKFEGGASKATMSWQIAKAQLTVEWDSYEFYENNGVQTPTAITLYEFYGNDRDLFKADDLEYLGDIKAMTSGEYTITIAIKTTAAWASNYELDKSKTCSFVILPQAGMEIITLEWDSKTLFEYNANVQYPSFKVVNRVGGYIDVPMAEFRFNEESQTSRYAGDYEIIVTMRPGSNYYLTGKTNCYYTITPNADGMGNKPSTDIPNPPEQKPNDDGAGDNNTQNTMQLPLWQLIVTGVSAVLFVVCAAKSFSEYGKLKEAKRKGKELASVSYAVTYGFAPLPLLAEIAFLGLGETAWTAIAFVALGLFLISLAAMLVLSKKRKAAELVVEREQARIDEEKEYMRQEERRAEKQERDEEMKMMFAAMQQGFQQQQPALNYGDMQNMIAASMQALLPAMSQMAALPPAQSDPSAYADPYAQPAPQFGAPQYGTSSSEADALRAQLAQQQAQMAQQQEMMAQQQAQMAQQQAMLNQLMQNQQGAAAYANYEEDAHDEALWQDDGDVISLEESYGKLSEEAKRCYYDIGSYIMNKPKIAQNDGKYAVLFKYRGKTLFKLCIRGDAPVLFYTADNGARDSVRIADNSGLNAAKSVIDVCVMKRDRELSQ